MANQTAELVKEWALYEESYPETSIEDFCRYYLISVREKQDNKGALAGKIPPHAASAMAKLMGRLVRLYTSFGLQTLKKVGITNFDDFTYLASIFLLKDPNKTEVINENVHELSSGLLIINRLIEKGYVREYTDDNDRRSKRLRLTPEGDGKLQECFQLIRPLNELFFGSIPKDDIELCFQLLTPLEIKFCALWIQHKGKELKDVPG
jgi:DNA-binding MarR family transcriptional regulator